ncbi:hypothetical protein [Pseudactinotalea sp. Z1748]|uniref:hypothetical protein n=1 Tax=Pseudactinotalea sp. Z1748 TaxID=3413027 RepID=UPI003C7DD638
MLEQVRRNTAGHQLRVLHDEGLYRHLRFTEPGTSIWHFDVITWPGHLSTAGDVGAGFTFSRAPNMLAFFDTGQPDGHINADYWAEKLTGSRDVRTWSAQAFRTYATYATDAVNDVIEGGGLSADEVQTLRAELDDVLSVADDEGLTLARWSEVSAGGYAIEDEWDSRAWTANDHQLLLAMHLILTVAKTYHATHARQGTRLRPVLSVCLPVPLMMPVPKFFRSGRTLTHTASVACATGHPQPCYIVLRGRETRPVRHPAAHRG